MPDFQPKFESLVQVFNRSMEKFSDRALFGVKRDDQWHWMTYGEWGDRVRRLHTALQKLGVGAGDRVAIISNNNPEWAMGAYASYGLGAAYVAMYESQLDKDWQHIIKDCGAKVLFVANEQIAQRVRSFRDDLPELEHVVVLSGAPQGGEHAFADLLRNEPSDLMDPGPDAIAVFIYTSGTTGNPKGVRLTHRNLAYNVSAIHAVFPMEPDDRSLCFLPWAHSFGQTVELHGMLSMGASIGLAEAVDKIVANLAEVRPTLFISVPRVFNRIYDGLQAKMKEDGGLKQKLFDAAMATAEQRKKLAAEGKRSAWVDFKFNILDGLVFSKVRERFGGRLKYAFSGGAAISKEVAEFIDNLGITVYEGYGLSETSPIATANYPGARKIGSVGKPIPGVEIEIDLSATEDPTQGEILIYGHNVMQGYHNLDQANAEVLIEKNGLRGFRSGDMGKIDEEGFLHITGRVKEQYKLLNGKYVVPTPLEEKMKLSPYISSAMVHGMNREYNVAIIIPDYEALKAWAIEKGLDAGPSSLAKSDAVRALIEEEVEKYSSDFKGYEKARKIYIGEEDFTTENGMLTPTLKLKRRVVQERYGEAIESLYA
ncbi:MAG: long-chain fatty acid--CoA ligase [Myxococcales bacterium SG8_38_1]|nr:MAG: long-chain fatty acid--CoA ligase [Myxococcales bacterium SG8_38_1]